VTFLFTYLLAEAVHLLSGQVLQGFDYGRSNGRRPTHGQCQASTLVSNVLTCVMVMGFVLQDSAGQWTTVGSFSLSMISVSL